MKRRTFLSRCVLVGLGLATPISAASATPLLSASCDAKPSPADALDIYKPLLYEIENEIIQGFVEPLVRVSKRCTDLLLELRTKVIQLENEVKTNKPQGQTVTTLVDTVTKQQVTSTTSPDAATANAVALSSISQQIRGKVEDVLNPGDKLSPTAAKLINEIVALIKQSTAVEQDLVAEQARLTKKLNDLRDEIRSLGQMIVQATRSIDRATHSNTSASDVVTAKNSARTQLVTAVDRLLSIVKQATDRPPAIERINTLSLALNGVIGWIDNLEQISNRQYAMTSRASSLSFVKASLVSEGPEPSPSELEALIEKHCGRGSALQIQTLITGYLAVVSGLVFFKRVSNTPEAKSDALLNLMRGTAFTNPVCDPDQARSNLAKAIAHLVP